MRQPLLTLLAAPLLLLLAPDALRAQELPDEERVRWERQIAYVETLLRAEPSVPLHHLRMAQAWARMGDERRVLDYTEQAVRLGGSPLAADILVGDFYSNMERPADATQRYLRVLKASPDQSHVLTQLWFIVRAALVPENNLRLPVRLEDLIALLNARGYYVAQKTDGDPDGRAAALISDGDRRLASGDLTGAQRAFESAAALDPWSPQIYRGLGSVYARQKQADRAVGAYTLYVVLAPPDDRDATRARKIIFDYYRKRTGG